MIRRQPAYFSVYFILVGVLLALTSTQPCSGEGTLALAKRNDNDESLHELLQVPTASLQATGAGIRYLEDKENSGNKTNEVEGGDADDDDEGGDDDGKQEEAGDESGGNQTSGKVVDKDSEGGEDDDNNADDESGNGAADKEAAGGGEDGDGKPSEDDPDKEKGGDSEAGKEDDEQKGNAGEDEGDNDDKAGNNDEEEKKAVEESEGEANSKANDEDEKAKEASNEGASENSTPVPPKNDDWEGAYGEPEVGKYIIGFLALIAVIAVYLKFCRGRIGGGGGMISSSSQRPHHGKYETVASDDAEADDWGWDDENGDGDDIELAGKPSQPIPSPSGLSLTHRSPSLEGRDVVKNAHVNRQKGLHLPPPASPMQQQQQQSVSQVSPSSQMNPPPQMITSLGAPKVPAKKAPVRKAQDDDDIFASMGLAAQPKFQTTRPAAKPNSGWGAVAAAPASAPLPKIPVPADSFDAADNWDNDDDLDDLFDD